MAMGKRIKKMLLLPDDIILVHILPRVPAKSLGRFTSVCKQWHSYLTSPHFTQILINNQNHNKLLLLPSTNTNCNYFQTIDCQEPQLGLSPKRTLPFEAGSNGISIISSLNGLLCVGIKFSDRKYPSYSDIILWNPLTGAHKALSKGNNNNKIFGRAFGLYYSCCDDDYKLLRVGKSSNNAYIYSWKWDSWRKAKSRFNTFFKFWQFGCLLDGKLYFIAQSLGDKYNERCSYMVVKFDTETEMFREFATPLFKTEAICLELVVRRGCIHMCVYPRVIYKNNRLWKLDEDGNWSMVVRCCSYLTLYRPWHQMKDGDWLTHVDFKSYICKVNPKTRMVKRLLVYNDKTNPKMEIHQRGKFVETFVSPN